MDSDIRLELRDLSSGDSHTSPNELSGQASSPARSSSTLPQLAEITSTSDSTSGGETLVGDSNVQLKGSAAKSWSNAAIDFICEELKSITRLQWLIMMVVGVIVLPWAYKTYRLAQWTAKLDYLRQCRATLVC